MFALPLFAALAGVVAPAHAVPDDFEFELEGYYRTRGYVFGNLFEGQDHGSAKVHGAAPSAAADQLNYNDLAKFDLHGGRHPGRRGLGRQRLPRCDLALRGRSVQHQRHQPPEGRDRAARPPSIKRAWVEFRGARGPVVRLGRQESGLGPGSPRQRRRWLRRSPWARTTTAPSSDRVLFATKPVAIAQAHRRPRKEKLGDMPLSSWPSPWTGSSRIPSTSTTATSASPTSPTASTTATTARCDSDGDGIHRRSTTASRRRRPAPTIDRKQRLVGRQRRRRGSSSSTWLAYKGEGIRMSAGRQRRLLTLGDLGGEPGPDRDGLQGLHLLTSTPSSCGPRHLLRRRRGCNIRGKSSRHRPARRLRPLRRSRRTRCTRRANIWGYVGKRRLQAATLFDRHLRDRVRLAATTTWRTWTSRGVPSHPDYNVGPAPLRGDLCAGDPGDLVTETPPMALWSRGRRVQQQATSTPTCIYRPHGELGPHRRLPHGLARQARRQPTCSAPRATS